MIDTYGLLEQVKENVKNNFVKSLTASYEYDAMVEGIDLRSRVHVSVTNTNDGFSIEIDMSELNSYEKELFKDRYLQNGITRRKWMM